MKIKINLFKLLFFIIVSFYLFTIMIISKEHLSNKSSLTVHLDSLLIAFSNIDNALFELYQYGTFQVFLYLPLLLVNYFTSDLFLSFTFICWCLAVTCVYLLLDLTKNINFFYSITSVLFYVYCVFYYPLAFGNYDLYYQSSVFIFFPLIFSCYLIFKIFEFHQNNNNYKFFALSNALLIFNLGWSLPVYIIVSCSFCFIYVYLQIKKFSTFKPFIFISVLFCQFLFIAFYIYFLPDKTGWLTMMKVYLSSNTSYRILEGSFTEIVFISFFIIIILNLAKNYLINQLEFKNLISFLFFSIVSFFLCYRFIVQSTAYMYFYYFAWPLLLTVNFGPDHRLLNCKLDFKHLINLVIIFTIIINFFYGFNNLYKKKYSVKDSTFDYYTYYEILDKLEQKNFYLVNFQSLFYFISKRDMSNFFLNKNQFVLDEHIEEFINILAKQKYDNIIISEEYFYNSNYRNVLLKILDHYKSKPIRKKILNYSYYELKI